MTATSIAGRPGLRKRAMMSRFRARPPRWRRWRGRVRGRCGRDEGPAAAPGQPSSSCASRLPLRHAARPRGALRAHVQRRIQPTDQPDHHRLGSLSHRARDAAGPGVRVALSAPGSAGSRPAERLRVIAEQDRFNVTQSGLTQMYALLSAVADGSDHPATLVFRSPASASSAAPGARGKDGAEGPSLCSR